MKMGREASWGFGRAVSPREWDGRHRKLLTSLNSWELGKYKDLKLNWLTIEGRKGKSKQNFTFLYAQHMLGTFTHFICLNS